MSRLHAGWWVATLLLASCDDPLRQVGCRTPQAATFQDRQLLWWTPEGVATVTRERPTEETYPRAVYHALGDDGLAWSFGVDWGEPNVTTFQATPGAAAYTEEGTISRGACGSHALLTVTETSPVIRDVHRFVHLGSRAAVTAPDGWRPEVDDASRTSCGGSWAAGARYGQTGFALVDLASGVETAVATGEAPWRVRTDGGTVVYEAKRTDAYGYGIFAWRPGDEGPAFINAAAAPFIQGNLLFHYSGSLHLLDLETGEDQDLGRAAPPFGLDDTPQFALSDELAVWTRLEWGAELTEKVSVQVMRLSDRTIVASIDHPSPADPYPHKGWTPLPVVAAHGGRAAITRRTVHRTPKTCATSYELLLVTSDGEVTSLHDERDATVKEVQVSAAGVTFVEDQVPPYPATMYALPDPDEHEDEGADRATLDGSKQVGRSKERAGAAL